MAEPMRRFALAVMALGVVVAIVTYGFVESGRSGVPVARGPSGFQVDALGMVEGCRMYRVQDARRRTLWLTLCGPPESPTHVAMVGR